MSRVSALNAAALHPLYCIVNGIKLETSSECFFF